MSLYKLLKLAKLFISSLFNNGLSDMTCAIAVGLSQFRGLLILDRRLLFIVPCNIIPIPSNTNARNST